MPKKFTLEFQFGKSTVIFIVIAALAGIAIGNLFPFEKGLTSEQRTQTLGQQTPVTGFSSQDIKKWVSEIGLNTNQFTSCFDSQKYLDQIGSEFQEGADLGVSGTPAFFIGTKDKGFVAVVGAQPYDVFNTVIDSYLNGTAPPGEVVLTEDHIGNAPIIGNKDAQVLIVEFSDFQCPFCRAFYTQTLSQIETEYINSGKVALVYKDFPLTSIHPGAVPYALAAKCAQEQGKWREMHDKIFDEQNKLGLSTIPYG